MTDSRKLRRWHREAERLSQASCQSPSETAATYMADLLSAADRLDQLEALVDALDITVMHPHMDGRHQCTIRANGRLLTTEQWDLILSCRAEGGASS